MRRGSTEIINNNKEWKGRQVRKVRGAAASVLVTGGGRNTGKCSVVSHNAGRCSRVLSVLGLVRG